MYNICTYKRVYILSYNILSLSLLLTCFVLPHLVDRRAKCFFRDKKSYKYLCLPLSFSLTLTLSTLGTNSVFILAVIRLESIN